MDDNINNFSLSPVNFFQIGANCHFVEKRSFPQLSKTNLKKYLLPDTSALCGEDTFAQLGMGWNQEGIELYVVIGQAMEQCQYPDVERGDSVELFFDTRDVKTSGFNTRFCHHFFFLPESVEGIQAGEITRFRTEDIHELCDPNELKIKTDLRSKEMILQIFIPSQCLYGYDPDQFNRMGFTYRINRYKGKSQHFSATSDDYQIEQQPSLWSTLQLVK